MSQRTYEAVKGFFVQESGALRGQGELPPRFGLIDSSDDRWKTFRQEIDRLNTSSPANTQYKVIFVGRHGQGFHNVAEGKYGTEVRPTIYWAREYGDGELIWGPDPELTEVGKDQAKSAHDAWKQELKFDIPLPGKLYSSPLTRAIHTHQITFDSIIPKSQRTMIVEDLREVNGVHTCDKRRTRTYIAKKFPDYDIEEGFVEEDIYWNSEKRETHGDIDIRMKRVLDMIFDRDEEQFISFTGHGGIVGSVLRVTKHKLYVLPTGGVLPVIVKSSIS
ncbi:histidine phosphatase superfamily [Suillus clintonianus]|uniref:histidine phosphatase superfamily n=1 Tax=Suillus clintonianus TaxID=1904413 RepID=UPI001B86AB6D|nr:histidine phosphatase superfamily [Suillus clintonianus]KAG2143629.1 histidine phosphatase superfamily [Suillus clintonianus]